MSYYEDMIEDEDTDVGEPTQSPLDSFYRITLPMLTDPGEDKWRAQGMCIVYPSVDFFSGKAVERQRAKNICAECTVRTECLDFALRNGEEHGVWGGLDPTERRALRKA